MVEMKQFEVKPGVVLPAVKVDRVIVMNDGTVRIQYLEKVEEKPSENLAIRHGSSSLFGGVQEAEQTTIKKPEKSGGKKEK